jgi:hypothetical protein
LNKREIEILKWCSSTQYEIREEEEEAQRVFSLVVVVVLLVQVVNSWAKGV